MRFLIYLLFFCGNLFAQNTDYEALLDSTDQLNAYEFKDFISASEDKESTLKASKIVYHRIENKIPITPRAIATMCLKYKVFVDYHKTPEYLESLILLDYKHDPALLMEVMHQRLKFNQRGSKYSSLSREQFLEKMYQAREYSYYELVKLQEANYGMGMEMIARKDYNKADRFLRDVFNTDYTAFGIGTMEDKLFDNRISGELYRLQKKAFLDRTRLYVIQGDTKMLEILKKPQFKKFYIYKDILPEFNKLLKKAGVAEIEGEAW